MVTSMSEVVQYLKVRSGEYGVVQIKGKMDERVIGHVATIEFETVIATDLLGASLISTARLKVRACIRYVRVLPTGI